MIAPCVALVIGHSARSPGAAGIPPLAAEYFYNMELGGEIKSACEALGVTCNIITRNFVGLRGAYDQVNLLNPQACIELHYNSFNSFASGTETLFGGSHSQSADLASVVHKEIVIALSRSKATDRGIKKLLPGDRGSTNVNLAKCPSVLIEPFFGDHKDDSKLGHGRMSELANGIAKAVKLFITTKGTGYGGKNSGDY